MENEQAKPLSIREGNTIALFNALELIIEKHKEGYADFGIRRNVRLLSGGAVETVMVDFKRGAEHKYFEIAIDMEGFLGQIWTNEKEVDHVV